ncbi:MAG: VWA domain-containing protein [Victivallales bacterium]
MNHTSRTYFIVISVILSLMVHTLVFTVSKNITFRSIFLQEPVQKPSRYLKLGTVSMKSPEPGKPDTGRKAQLIRSDETVNKNSSQNFPGSRVKYNTAGDGIKNTPPPDSFRIPKAPSPGTLQKIMETDGDKLSRTRLQVNRLIVPKIVRADLPSFSGDGASGGGSGGGPIELKLRIPFPLRSSPDLPPNPAARLLPREDLPVIDSLMDVKLFKFTEPDGNGFFRIDITPGKKVSGLKPFMKDVVFCIDSSGSISKEKLDEFREGVLKSIKKMNPDDRLEIISFKHKAFPLFGGLRNPSPENIRLASEFLSGLQRHGSTNIYSAVEPFVNEKFKTPDRPLLIFLASDGNVNTGEVFDSRALVNEISNKNHDNASIFTFSSGRDKNSFLLDLLAYRNRGESLTAREVGSSRVALENFTEDVSGIAVTDLDYQVSGNLSEFAFPKKLPHLYSNHTLSVYGKFTPETKDLGLRITGADSLGKKQEFIFAGNLDDALDADEQLPKKWALQYIYNLYSRLTADYDETLKTEIYRTASKYGVDVPYLDKYLKQ